MKALHAANIVLVKTKENTNQNDKSMLERGLKTATYWMLFSDTKNTASGSEMHFLLYKGDKVSIDLYFFHFIVTASIVYSDFAVID